MCRVHREHVEVGRDDEAILAREEERVDRVDELRVLVLVATRARAGLARYGFLDLRRDRRDFQGEALEELADGLFYSTAALLSRRRRGGARRPARRPGTPHV